MITTLAAVTLVLAALPAVLALTNLLFYRRPPAPEGPLPAVSILIPARNEEVNIENAVRSALSSQGVEVEVLVMDDHSSDRTPAIVRGVAREDSRVRLLQAPKLPDGWAGKQHACHRLAEQARYPLLLFVDADVVLSTDAAAKAAAFLTTGKHDLVSGFPRQLVGSPVEQLVIPLIHFVLLGYLPMAGMRWSRWSAFAAGCGQFFLARREAYEAVGGHGAIRNSFHDGVKLPRAFRDAGFSTDLFDATDLVLCRMYYSDREVVMGLAKNAHEGMAGPVAIWVWSVLLLGGHVLPALLAVWGILAAPSSTWFAFALGALTLGFVTRLVLAFRFRQNLASVTCHPLGVALLVGIQWYSWIRRRTGRAIGWKDRGVPA